MSPVIMASHLLGSLPPPWPEDLAPAIRTGVAASKRKLVVLDDDPTGTQTVYDLPVLTTWDVDVLRREFLSEYRCFYVLTNSRSMPADRAYALNLEIARNLLRASEEAGVEFSIVSRSDSTLRGHFPGEVAALKEELGPFDAVLVIPFFEQGGRYTVGDIHYVAEDDTLIPAAETPFAQDSSFGYRSSDLREWIAEKSGGSMRAESVSSISIEEIRTGGPQEVRERLLRLGRSECGEVSATTSRDGSTFCVINSVSSRDLEVVVQAVEQAETAGRRFLFRTAASFVAVRLGLLPRSLWVPSPSKNATGGLTIVGSYVPKTTGQLERLLADCPVEPVELSVEEVLRPERCAGELLRAAAKMNQALGAGRDVVVFTSRNLITGSDPVTSLDIGGRISNALVVLVQQLATHPRYLIAKGGITSSDLATSGLGVKRATILGQVLPGVPVWGLGPETRFPGLPYVVFPGNVGSPKSLSEVVQKFNVC